MSTKPKSTSASTAPKAPAIPGAIKSEVPKALDSQAPEIKQSDPEFIEPLETSTKDGYPSDMVIPEIKQSDPEEDKEEAHKQESLTEQDDNFVFAEKDGEVKRFTKVTWDELKKSPSGYKIVPNTPPEVKALKK